MKLFSTPPLSQFGKAKPGPVAQPARLEGGAEASAARLMPIQRLAQGGRWRVEAMRALSEPCLLWFTRGQGRITIGGVTRGYGPHNAILIPAGVMHGFEAGPQTHGMVLFFGRHSGIDLPATVQHLRIREASKQAELSGIFEAIQRELGSDKANAARAAQHHLGLLGVWIERQVEAASDDSPRPSASKRLAARYTQLLERDFRTGLGVADLAESLGVTPTHLSRACRETCGRSASDLLQDRRLFEARRLLADTELPIKEISRSLGFTSPAYFSRAFQHRAGKTPSAFRRAG